jgi:preprotein translocase subunit YajC
MFISKAYAQAVEKASELSVPNTAEPVDPNAMALKAANAPSAMEAFMWNMGLVAVMVALFYVLLIKPQQKRFKEHGQMLQGLKKGDKVVTGGGLVGVIDKLTEGSDEVVVDLGNSLKVTALRGTLQIRETPVLKEKPAKAKS